MRKNLQRVLAAWNKGEETTKPGETISTDGRNIYSYWTCIVARTPTGGVVFNASEYSPTTKRQQNAIRAALLVNFDAIVTDAPRGVTPEEIIALAGK